MFFGGFGLSASAGFFGFGWRAGLLALAVAAAFAASLRVRVVVTRRWTTVTRRAFFVLPWWRTRHAGPPQLFVDGWGDFADPEALHLGFDAESATHELAWVGRYGSARRDALVSAFNDGVKQLQGATPA